MWMCSFVKVDQLSYLDLHSLRRIEENIRSESSDNTTSSEKTTLNALRIRFWFQVIVRVRVRVGG